MAAKLTHSDDDVDMSDRIVTPLSSNRKRKHSLDDANSKSYVNLHPISLITMNIVKNSITCQDVLGSFMEKIVITLFSQIIKF